MSHEETFARAAALAAERGAIPSGRHSPRMVRLPGEIPATVSDPWVRPLDAEATAPLRAFGAGHGVGPDVLGDAWLAARDAFGCLVRYGWPWSGAGGSLWRWAHAVENLIDGEATESPPLYITE